MKFLKVLVVIILLNPCFEVLSNETYKWSRGKIELKNGSTLSGSIKYRPKYNVLMYKVDGKIKTYTADLINYFEIRGKDFKSINRYYSVPVKIDENRMKPEFFEVVTTGSITLLKREALVRKRRGKRTEVTKVSRFFYMDQSGTVQPLMPSKKSILKLMDAHARVVSNFMTDLELKPSKSAHMKQLFIFYNTLCRSSN